MKIRTKHRSYEDVMSLPRPIRTNPLKPNILLHTLIRILSIPTLFSARFSCSGDGLDAVKEQPCLILMNHSSFIDLKIASRLFYPKPFSIVSTMDGLVGKKWLMRRIGCIPTRKFVSDPSLIRDMKYALTELRSSVLMFPEAGYSLDGRATTLPKHLGAVLKWLKVPVVMVTTFGAFARDPLYNGLQLRRVTVKADVKLLFSGEDVKTKSIDELDNAIDEAFSFDQFRWQQENRVKIAEKFRADGLERVLYKCASCKEEGFMRGKGEILICEKCQKAYRLDEYGWLSALSGKTEFAHIPDWFDWQRSEVQNEIRTGAYRLDADVDIGMLVDHKALYMVGSGRLTHDENGFKLTDADGKINYAQSALTAHTLNVDYFWYEIGDVICIGNMDALYYCFPRDKTSVTRARLAAEEIYRMKKDNAEKQKEHPSV